MRFLGPLLIFFGALSFAGPGPAVAGPPETPGEHHEQLAKRAVSAGSVAVIVELRATMTLEATLPSAAAVANQRAELTTRQNRVLERLPTPRAREAVAGLKRFHLYPGFAMQASAAELEALLEDPEVEAIHPDRLHTPLLNESLPLIGADEWDTFGGYRGSGQTIAILDTGVDKNHSFLVSKVIAEACFSTNNSDAGSNSLCPGSVSESTDVDSGIDCAGSIWGCGHGTHVAGIVAGKGSSFNGVASEATLIAVQVFSKFTGSPCTDAGISSPCAFAWTSDIIKGLEHIHTLRDTHEIASVNMSLGGGSYASPCPSTPMEGPIVNLRAANIATIVASGNNGSTNAIGYPACVPDAVSVGSTDKQDVISTFTNSAHFLDLLAPGQWIYSSTLDNSYEYLAGTSMAAPHVAGAWAIIRESHPSATVDDVLTALKGTGVLIIDSRSGAENRMVPRIRPLNATSALGEAVPDDGGNETDGDFDDAGPGDSQTPAPIANGQSIDALAGEPGSEDLYYIDVPAGASEIEISISGGIGDADLYLRRGGLPTLIEYDCRPWLWGNNETCIIENPDAGAWYIMLHAYDAYEGLTLTARYTSEITCHHENHQEIDGRLSNLVEVTACRTITTAEMGLTITSTGDARFTAGERITLRPGFSVAAGGRFRAKVAPALAN